MRTEKLIDDWLLFTFLKYALIAEQDSAISRFVFILIIVRYCTLLVARLAYVQYEYFRRFDRYKALTFTPTLIGFALSAGLSPDLSRM